MYSRTLLRGIFLLTVIIGGFYFLAMAGKASAERIKVQEAASENKLITQTSNTEYIFFESIAKFVVTAIVR